MPKRDVEGQLTSIVDAALRVVPVLASTANGNQVVRVHVGACFESSDCVACQSEFSSMTSSPWLEGDLRAFSKP